MKCADQIHRELPPHIEVIDGGAPAFDLLPYFHDKDRVIIVDARGDEQEATP